MDPELFAESRRRKLTGAVDPGSPNSKKPEFSAGCKSGICFKMNTTKRLVVNNELIIVFCLPTQYSLVVSLRTTKNELKIDGSVIT